MAWDPAGLLYGRTGFTAISQRWGDQNQNHPTASVVALTRRHGYTRGHGMIENYEADGFYDRWNGKKVWFANANNQVKEVTIRKAFVRKGGPSGPVDYTILLFDQDLDSSITPMSVMPQHLIGNALGPSGILLPCRGSDLRFRGWVVPSSKSRGLLFIWCQWV
jgi:hypothetical protein